MELFQIPEICPVCSGPTVSTDNFLYCRNKSCPAKLSGAVKVWVNRLGLLHWGDALIYSLTDQDAPKIRSLADLYRLDIGDIEACCSGYKVARKCYDTLHGNKTIPLELLIGSLNIHNLAIATATDIVNAGYDTIEKVLNASLGDLEKISNIGKITAQSIYDGLQERREVILDLASVLNVQAKVSGPLSGKVFCITLGTSKPRKAIEKMIMEAGGIAKGSVGKGTTHLVCNYPESDTDKLKNARKLSIPIISESSLYALMDS